MDLYSYLKLLQRIYYGIHQYPERKRHISIKIQEGPLKRQCQHCNTAFMSKYPLEIECPFCHKQTKG